MANNDMTISKYIKSGISFRLDVSDRNNSSPTLDKIAEARPDLPAYNEDGSYYLHHYYDALGKEQWLENPLITINSENGSQDKTLTLSGNIDFSNLPDLLLKLRASYNYSNSGSRMYDPSTTVSGSNNFKGQLGSLSQGFSSSQNYNLEGQLSYSLQADKHALDAVGVVTFADRSNVSNSFVFTDFPDDSKQTALWQGSNYKNHSGNEGCSILFSTVLRASYRYAGRYLLTASIRSDVSANFAPEYRKDFFPSIGLGWIVSDEKFMKPVKKWVPYLKCWGSMGKTGIAASGSTDEKNEFRNSKYMDLPAVIPYQIGNEELKWETTMQYDAAVEFALLKGSKIRGSVGWYMKDTEGLLNTITLQPSAGKDKVNVIIATIRNTGIEFELSSTLLRKKNFSWDFSINVSKNVNKNRQE